MLAGALYLSDRYHDMNAFFFFLFQSVFVDFTISETDPIKGTNRIQMICVVSVSGTCSDWTLN